MSAEVKLQRTGDRIQLSIEFTIRPGTAMLDYEEQIVDVLNRAGQTLTVQCLEQFDTDGAPIVIAGTKLTSKGPVQKNYQTPYGEVGVWRHVYQSSAGGQTFCPLNQQARIVNGTTPRFAKMCASKYTLMNSVGAQNDLLENHRRKVSRCYLQDIAEEVSTIAQAKEDDWQYAEPELGAPVATAAVGIDGTCLLFCQEGWRQAMVGTISLYDAVGERLHTIYLASAPEYGKEAFYERMDSELQRCKNRYPGIQWIGLADGAHDNWGWLEQRTDRAILDFWHGAGYLEKAAGGVCPSRKERTHWFEQARHRLKQEPGAAAKLLQEMQQAQEGRRLTRGVRKDLQSAITYFENHLDKMNYAQYRRRHWPIGSGVTEAACKTVVKQRLCGSGMKWKYSGAATVLRLRSLILTKGRWQQFWGKISRFGF